MKSRQRFCLVMSILLFCINYAKAGTTYTWSGGTSGSWATSSNWSPSSGYPGSSGSTTDIAIVNTNNVTINYSGNLTISQLESNNNGAANITINFTGTAPTLAITSGVNMVHPSHALVGITFSGTGTATISGTSTFVNHASMTISIGVTVTASAGSTIDFSSDNGILTNNGTLNLTSSTLNLGSSSSFVSPGTVIANNSNFDISGTPAFISYAGNFVANSCIFTVPSNGYIASTSTSSAFTSTSSTFNLTGSGAAAYFYNNGTFRDHKSVYNLEGQDSYIQNSGSSATMHLSGTTVNFSTSQGNDSQNINNSGTFTADSASAINAATYLSYITNSGTFYAGTSGSSCVTTLSGQGANIANTGIFYLGSTSIIYPSGYQATVTNTSPGVFTLQSDANGSAAIGALSSTATCNGTFNVERYFQGSTIYNSTQHRWEGRSYRIISSAVNNGTKVNSNYVYGLNYIVGATAGATTGANSATNAFITGCTGCSTSAGNPSTYLFRESIIPANSTFTDGNFLGITNITNSTSAGTITASDGNTYSLPIGNGVFFFFRGAATNWSTKTVAPFIAPENVTLTATGNINQQSVTVKDWYNPTSSNLGYTVTGFGTGSNTNTAVRGFNMVGNPFPSSIDWNTINTGGIAATNINPTIYMFDPVTNQYDSYKSTGASSGTGNPATTNSIIASGQGFLVQANAASPSLIINETAKSATSQLLGGNLLMGTPLVQAPPQLLRLRLAIDTLNYDDIVIGFNSSASTKYNGAEDAEYLPGVNAMEGLASFSSDSVLLAMNFLPLPKQTPLVINLDVHGRVTGLYTFQRTALDAIAPIYEIWLMDTYKKDSLDLRNNANYAFNIDVTDTNSYGANRFKLVIRQSPALMVHLLSFTATKATGGSAIVWKTENEQNYTNFTVERSTDGGATFDILGGSASSALDTYSFLDKNPQPAANQYRLKIEDLNGAISYSNIVTLIYGNSNMVAGNINIYPNPASSVINLAINKTTTSFTNLPAIESLAVTPGINSPQAPVSGQSYGIKIISITGAIVKSATSTQPNWENNISNLNPGTYIIRVVNNNDKSVVGKATFVKL